MTTSGGIRKATAASFQANGTDLERRQKLLREHEKLGLPDTHSPKPVHILITSNQQRPRLTERVPLTTVLIEVARKSTTPINYIIKTKRHIFAS